MNDMTDDEEIYDREEQICFVNCSCAHEREQHGWGHCDVDGCPCEGGWEE